VVVTCKDAIDPAIISDGRSSQSSTVTHGGHSIAA
jgi:hypothetical protein